MDKDHLAAAPNGSPGGAKVSVTLQDLRSWAVVAQSRGTEHAFVGLALEWAAAAMREIERLRECRRALAELLTLAEVATPLLADATHYKTGRWGAALAAARSAATSPEADGQMKKD